MKYLLWMMISFMGSHSFGQLTKVSTDYQSKNNYPLSLSVLPIHLINNTFKIDAELQRKEKNTAYILGLEVIYGEPSILYPYKNKTSEVENTDNVEGAGINVGYKYKFGKSNNVSSFYFAPGLTFRKVNLRTEDQDYYTYTENGVEFITFGNIEKSYNINSLLTYANLGYHKVWDTSILLDGYFGFGFKASTRNNQLNMVRDYDKHPYGYTYNGFLVQLGLKFGFQLR